MNSATSSRKKIPVEWKKTALFRALLYGRAKLVTKNNEELHSESHMKPERWPLVNDILQTALEKEPKERAAFLERICDGKASLRAEVDRLIELQNHAAGFLESPIADIASNFSVIKAQEEET